MRSRPAQVSLCEQQPSPLLPLARFPGAAIFLPTSARGPMAFKLISPAFGQNRSIPTQYTCDGEDISPPLLWSDVPSGTKSLALIVDDPDAPDPAKPERVYVHWVVYNISPIATKLPLNAAMSG